MTIIVTLALSIALCFASTTTSLISIVHAQTNTTSIKNASNSAVTNATQSIGNKTSQPAPSIGSKIGHGVQSLVNATGNALKSAGNATSAAAQPIGNKTGQGVQSLVNATGKLLGNLSGTAKNLLGGK